MVRSKSSVPGSNRSSAVGEWDQVDVAALRPAVRRTRSHPAAKRRTLEASVREYGILDPVTINSSNVIVDGHLRVDIARKLGFRTVPVIRISHLSDTELRMYGIAANKFPAVANIDPEAFRLELEELRADMPTLDLTLTGFSIGELNRIDGNDAARRYDDLDEVDPPAAAPSSTGQHGDLYALGSHRLLCGNSLDPDAITAVMGDERASCCFTDPPYNVKINGHVSGTGRFSEFPMASGEMIPAEFQAFLTTALGNIQTVLRDGAIAFVCMDHGHIMELLLAGETVFEQRLNICVWDKGRGGMGSPWRSQHELVTVFKKGTAPHADGVELDRV